MKGKEEGMIVVESEGQQGLKRVGEWRKRERKINRGKRKVEWEEEEGSERGSGQEEMC